MWEITISGKWKSFFCLASFPRENEVRDVMENSHANDNEDNYDFCAYVCEISKLAEPQAFVECKGMDCWERNGRVMHKETSWFQMLFVISDTFLRGFLW
jgi:hypothetical protein